MTDNAKTRFSSQKKHCYSARKLTEMSNMGHILKTS